MARAKGNGADLGPVELPLAFKDQLVADFRAFLDEGGPELVAGMRHAANRESSLSVTVALKRHPATKRRSGYTEARLTSRVRAPRDPKYYAVDFDAQGRLEFGGALEGPREAAELEHEEGEGAEA